MIETCISTTQADRKCPRMVVLGNQRLGITPVFGAMRLKPNSKPGVVPAAIPME